MRLLIIFTSFYNLFSSEKNSFLFLFPFIRKIDAVFNCAKTSWHRSEIKFFDFAIISFIFTHRKIITLPRTQTIISFMVFMYHRPENSVGFRTIPTGILGVDTELVWKEL